MKKKPNMPKTDDFTEMALAIQKYLDGKGWGVVVAGPWRIQSQPGARKYKFEFVMEFVGTEKEKK